ncbi:hypothetical protein [Streptomyces sp. NBC_00691]|uniref:hypothetical protein n=1 Tax=Streptomyces sp. NBC_00691 TaxID=2903671 RepID=UPI002E3539E3|nr:hypothetical protein [Streptomyces sp. NBC_00691]
MPAPSTAAGQTSTSPAARAAALTGPRGRRRAPVLGPAGAADPDPGSGPGAAGAVPRAGAGGGTGTGTGGGTGGGTGAAGGAADQQAGDVVRWAVFCCVLVPVVLLVYGSSLGGAAGTALGLVSVTAACRVLLRRSEQGMRSECARGRRRGSGTP